MSTKPIAIVTGANGVFGQYICQGIMKTHQLYCIVRNEEKGKQLMKFLNGVDAKYLLCDLSKPSSITALAKQFEGKAVQCLINNAAITPKKKATSEETGEELQWCVNVLAYHRLTKAFLPNLKLSSSQQTNNKSRVVFVASFYAGGLNLNDPEFKKRSYSSDSAYQASKQADRMLAFAWSKQCDDILFSSCHPHVATSAVSLGLGFDLDRSKKAQMQGAVTPLYCALSPKITKSGLYYSDSSLEECNFCQDANGVDKLWKMCELSS